MDIQRNITTLPGLRLTDATQEDDHLVLQAKWAKSRDTIEACPKCDRETATLQKHDFTESRMVRDTPWGGNPLVIYLKERRYKCSECKKTSVFRHPDVSDDRKMTEPLVEKIQRDALGPYRFNQLAYQVGCSATPVHELFEERVRELDSLPRVVPRVAGIDEVHVSGISDTCFVIGDLQGGRVIEILEGNKKDDLIQYLREPGAPPSSSASRGLEFLTEREKEMSTEELKEEYSTELEMDIGIEAVVMDMTGYYEEAVREALPEATVVVDRYHITRRANLALGRVRIDESRRTGLSTEWKREKEKLKKFRKQLQPGEKLRLEAALSPLPKLKDAYETRNEFLKIFELNSRKAAGKAFREWEENLPESVREEFESHVVKPLSNWWDEILNYFTVRQTNGTIEGLNRAIKQIQAEGVGYSFKTLRAKVIYGLPMRKQARTRGAVGHKRHDHLVREMSPGPRDETREISAEILMGLTMRAPSFETIEEELELW